MNSGSTRELPKDCVVWIDEHVVLLNRHTERRIGVLRVTRRQVPDLVAQDLAEYG